MPQAVDQYVYDWAATGTMLQGIGTLVGAGAVFLAARIGANSFKSWKQQKLAERHIEQAERILTATYKVRRALDYVRSPMMWSHELQAAEEKLKASGEWEKTLDEAHRTRLTTAQAYYDRLNHFKNERSLLEECQPMARAFFGEALEKSIEELNHQFHMVRVYVDAKLNDGNGRDREFSQKIDRIVWAGYPSAEENEVDRVIAEKVKFIEDSCVPVLRTEDGATGI